MADIRMGYSFRSRLEHDLHGDVTVIQMRDIDHGGLINAEGALRIAQPVANARHLLRVGDLLFRSRGRSYGAVLMATDIGAAVVSAPMLLVRPHAVLPEYLLWYLNSRAAEAQLTAVAEGTSVRMISVESLKALEVPVPSRDVQSRIAAVADLAERERTLVERLSGWRRRLTDHLLTKSAQEAMP
ncbi:MAG: restriction endonuclease subunit S [Trueperaceae bacterium]|nr:restriction endonuclease subunit S [Trueperaceae bacterium]